MSKTWKQKFFSLAREVKSLTFVKFKSKEERKAWKSFEKGLMWRTMLS